MNLLVIVYILIFVAFILVAVSVFQLKLVGLSVKDFWEFIDANQKLDRLYKFSKKYKNLTTQEQIIFLKEAELIFKSFDKVPDILWEEEYQKYMDVLQKYKDIKMLRWNEN